LAIGQQREKPVLILDDPTTWPDRLMRRLNQDSVIDLLRQHEFIEQVVKHPRLRPILIEIEEYVAATPLAAYHCTKQLAHVPARTPQFMSGPGRSYGQCSTAISASRTLAARTHPFPAAAKHDGKTA